MKNQETTTNDMLSFRLADRTYACPLNAVVQIIAMVTIVPLPQLNASIAGMINVRGTPIPVINLRRHLGLTDRARELHTPIILTTIARRTLGLIVDEVIDVITFSDTQIAHLHEVLPENWQNATAIKGVAHTDDDTVLVLDLERLFSADQAQHLQSILAEMEPVE